MLADDAALQLALPFQRRLAPACAAA
jgi:hypothetical protein